VDGTAFYYPDEDGERPDGTNKAKPFTLDAFNQIISVRNDAVADSIDDGGADTIEDKDGDVPFKKSDVQDLKTTIDEVQQNFEWHIPIGEENLWHHDDVTDLRRLSATPDTIYEFEPEEFPDIEAWCFGYFSDGMRIYANEFADVYGVGGSTGTGYTAYLGTQIAPPNQTHRFWVWTSKLVQGHHKGSTAGIIDTDGIMGPAVAVWPGNDGWHPGTDAGDQGYVDWTLLQYVQDVEPDIDALETAVHPLKGYIYWEAYTTNNTQDYEVVPSGIPPEEGDPFIVYYVFKSWSSCDNVVTTSSGSYPCDGYSCMPCPGGIAGSCSKSQSTEHDSEEEYVETGGNTFRTWEYYMDNQ
jgi:hypothetical protein